MTRKDYMKFAKAFSDARRNFDGDIVKLHDWHMLRNEMINIFAEDNPRFDVEKFIKATEAK